MNHVASSGVTNALEQAYYDGNRLKTANILIKAVRAGDKEVLTALYDHPLYDDWRDFAISSVAALVDELCGFVYIAGNPTQDGFFKVGMTGKAPEQRIASLNTAAVIGEFCLVHAWPVYDRFHVERIAHAAASKFPRHKEFFYAPWQDLVSTIDPVIKKDALLLKNAGLISAPH